MLRNFLSLLCVLLGAGMLHAQSMWTDLPSSDAPVTGERRIVPEKYRAMRLDLNALKPLLASAPVALTPDAQTETLPVIDIPMPDGKMVRFQLCETPVMAPELQEKYPEIRCYTGRGVNDASARVKLDLTPWGFHAMVTSSKYGSFFIDPMVHGNQDYYVVYFKKDYAPKAEHEAWSCAAPAPEDNPVELQVQHKHENATPEQGDTKLRRYRLALACTGEYATFHGGTKPLVLAAMNTTMNRVNGVYETDLAITMRIVPNNDLLIYLNASTDPFTNNDGGTMLGQNQTTCNNVIGTANYDVGHVFSTGGGGVAFLGIICSSTYKARGVTGLGSPVGDPFDIDYVAHEMGHQFGGPHTFNGTVGACGGNESPDDAVEPGSGSTIMAYAGICGSNNLQSNSDAYFSAKSLINMTAHAITGSGNTCAEKITTNNHNPTVNAGLNYTIPKSTPFALTAVGGDIDGDTLTYTWEQMDAAITTNPPVSTSTTGPMFRSFSATTSPVRICPRLQDIINNVNPTWEELPSVARVMNFRVVARDNDWFAGCTAEDDMAVTVSANSGPFLVTVPNTNILWNVGTTQSVTWDVANTTAAPVSCTAVRISLSTDGGYTYPIILSANEPNDGSATITVPNNLSNTCRVKVEGIGNIFFDISNANFRIEAPIVPTFFLATSVSDLTACAGENSSFSVDLTTVLNFNTPTNIFVSGAPAGATVDINSSPVVPAGSAAITISGLTPAMAGTYTLNIQAVAGSVVRNASVALTVLPGAPSVAALSSPANGATGVGTNSTLSWSSSFAASALLEVATNPSFSAASIVSTQAVTGQTAVVTGLTSPTVYYWRVRSSNSCGDAAFSPVFAFQVGTPSCDNNFEATNVPVVIDQATINTAVSTLNIPANRTIEDVNVNLSIDHSYVGDLIANLVSPGNDTILLFDRPGVPAEGDFGCSGDDAELSFDSETSQDPSLLESQCNVVNPSLSGLFQPIESLSILNGKNAAGDWKILITDNYPEDGGAITAWSLSFCFPEAIPAGNLLVNNTLFVGTATSEDIPTENLELSLSDTATLGQYILLSVPAHGTLTLNGVALAIGDSFTQADIDAGLVVYTNNGDASTTDNFHFDALDANNSSWVHDAIFNINVQLNNLVATAAQTEEILCHNGTTGQITVSATGLNGVYTYSLNGGTPQSSNVFSGLAAGTYTVVVSGTSGFTVSANTVVLTNPAQITASTSVVTDDVTVTASGGTGALEYSINGTDFQPESNFDDLENGVYTITIRDENGCTTTVEAIVAVNSLLITAAVEDAISCANGNDGSISVNVGGGEAPFSYSLNGGTAQLDNTFTGLSAGTYTVVVTDNEGFTATSSSVVLANPAPVTASASATLNVVTVNAAGGTGVYTYSANGGAYQQSNVFTGLTNGTYNISVQDENGCTTTTTVVVNVAPLVLSASATELNCFGGTDGTITADASGGIPPYEYKLNNNAYQSSPTFSGLAAGSYLLWIRDAVGTEISFEVTVAQPAQIDVSVAVSYNDATPTISGGTAPYVFSTNAPNIDLQDLPNGTYALVITDAHGCTASTSFTINVPPLAWSSVVTNVNCKGDSNGVIILTTTGGIPPYEYKLGSGAFQSSNIFDQLAAGNYAVVIVDAQGNQVTGNVTVGAPTQVVLSATPSGNSITAVATGGHSPYQYSLNGGPLQSSGTFSDLEPGTYTIVATDANGCTAVVSGVVISVAVVEPSEAWGLTVSPNPGSGLFQLTMQDAPAALRTEVFDASGRLLRSLNFTPNGGTFSTPLDLRELPNGTYILRLTDGQQWGAVRLSKVN